MRLLFILFIPLCLSATPTTITDTLLQPNGSPAAGVDFTITQTAFFSGSTYYPAWALQPHPVTDVNGHFSFGLEPNPTGQLYTVTLTQPNGMKTSTCWSVPVSVTPLAVQAVLSTACGTPPLSVVQPGQLAQGGATPNQVLTYSSLTGWGPASGTALPATVVYTSTIAGLHADGSPTANTGTDDRATLQTVMNTATSSSPLELVVDKGFLVIDSTGGGLVWNSNTKIRCNPGAGFSWKGSANANQQPMITNAHLLSTAAPQDSGLWMDGCIINGNHDAGHGGAGQLYPKAQNSHGVILTPLMITGAVNVSITNHKSYRAAGFGMWFTNVSQLKVENIRIEHPTGEFVTDGIHITGPASNFSIKNISGFTGDDMIAINADDIGLTNAAVNVGINGDNALASTPKQGAISGCLVEGVHLPGGSYNVGRLLSAQSALSCTIRNIDGRTTGNLFVIDAGPTWYGGQPGWQGNFGTVNIEDSSVTVSSAGCAWQLDGVFSSLSVDLNIKTQPTNPLLCTSAYTQIQDFRLNLKVANITAATAEILQVNGGSINSATITGTVDYANTGLAAHPIVNAIAGQITTLKVLNFEADYISNLVEVNGALVHDVIFSGGRHKHSTGGGGSLDIGVNGSVINATVSGFATNLFASGAGAVGTFFTGLHGDVVSDPSPIYTGAIAFYRMTEAAGAARLDYSGFGRTEANTGTVAQAACGVQVGNCASFTNNLANYLSTPGWPFTVQSGIGFTFAGWVKFTTLAAAVQTIFSKASEAELTYQNSTSKLQLCIDGGCISTPTTVTTATWYFVSGGWDPATSFAFISINNAADTLSGGITPAANFGTPMYFGSSGCYSACANALNGTLGPWGFWNRKLTASERTTLYNSGTFYDPTIH